MSFLPRKNSPFNNESGDILRKQFENFSPKTYATWRHFIVLTNESHAGEDGRYRPLKNHKNLILCLRLYVRDFLKIWRVSMFQIKISRHF